MNKHIGFALLAVIVLALNVQAVSITAPLEVPAQSTWTASVDFEVFNFEEARVELNGEKLVTVYVSADRKTALVTHSEKVLSAQLNGTVLTLSIAGLNAGTYALRAYVDNKLEGEKAILVFEALPESYRQETQQELQRLRELNNELEGRIEKNLKELDAVIANLNNKLVQVDKLLREKSVSLQEVQGSLSAIGEDLKALKAQAEELQSSDNGKTASLQELTEKINQLDEIVTANQERAKALSAGLIALPYTDPLSTLVFIIVIGLVVIGLSFAFQKWDREGLPARSGILFERTESAEPRQTRSLSDIVNAKPKTETSTSAEPQGKGKWAHKETGFIQPKKSESKGFALGDLIKKGR